MFVESLWLFKMDPHLSVIRIPVQHSWVHVTCWKILKYPSNVNFTTITSPCYPYETHSRSIYDCESPFWMVKSCQILTWMVKIYIYSSGFLLPLRKTGSSASTDGSTLRSCASASETFSRGSCGNCQVSAEYLGNNAILAWNLMIHILVGGLNPSEKYESQLGWLLFPIYGKIKTCSKPPTSDDSYKWFCVVEHRNRALYSKHSGDLNQEQWRF